MSEWFTVDDGAHSCVAFVRMTDAPIEGDGTVLYYCSTCRLVTPDYKVRCRIRLIGSLAHVYSRRYGTCHWKYMRGRTLCTFR